MVEQLRANPFIDGQDVAGDGRALLDDIDPATGDVLTPVVAGTAADVDAAVASARRAQRGWGDLAPRDRGKALIRLATLMTRDAEVLAETESRDTGKPLTQARLDVHSAAGYFSFLGEAADKHYGRQFEVSRGFAMIDRMPYGVVGMIVPWNFPLAISARGAAPALAVGNAVVLKPSVEAPLTPVMLARLAVEAGIPPGVLNVVTGRGSEVGSAITSHAGIDLIAFTGSKDIGIAVMQASSDLPRPVLLELGGKSPNIVFADTDLDSVVPAVAHSAMTHAGQVCSSASRLIVERSAHDDLVEAVGEYLRSFRQGPGIDDPDIGPVISARQHDTVMEYIQSGQRDGARLVVGGKRPQRLPQGYFIEPTLFAGADAGMRIANEEIFGPVLTAIAFDDPVEASAIANSTEYGLVTAVWTKDVDRAFAVARRIRAGQVFINNWGLGYGIDLPFGGVGGSGFGREKGLQSLDEYSIEKTVVVRVEDPSRDVPVSSYGTPYIAVPPGWPQSGE
jgi:aldehyde dehydrogenase (NAD+)/betaine-aldehyde dehydrogenase